MAVTAIRYAPLKWVVANDTRLAIIAAVWNVVTVVIRQRAVVALTVVDDAVIVAVGGPFDHHPNAQRVYKVIPVQ